MEMGAKSSKIGQYAVDILVKCFSEAGWSIDRVDSLPVELAPPDLIVSRGKFSYAVEVTASGEGRGDRLIPLWSQAYLKAAGMTRRPHRPLAIVAAPKISPRTANQILEFAAKYVPTASAGVIDLNGLRVFRGAQLEALNSTRSDSANSLQAIHSSVTNIFSDLNQWMLKVLLAPEIPEKFLSAPRERYRNASRLARAANASIMSASRLIQQLRDDGFLDESRGHLRLVRREALFKRWLAAAESQRVQEIPMRIALRGDPRREIKRISAREHMCLGLFAAADALGLGFVNGIPPHVYLKQLGPTYLSASKNLMPVEPNETPDLILRVASTPQSIFRGLVRVNDQQVSDVLQIWLDVSSHSSRGAEQADLIRDHVLGNIIRGDLNRG